MTYSRWATKEELKEKLAKYNSDSNVKKSGIQMMYNDKDLYIRDDEAHSLIVGSTGSGKTQTIILPNLRLAIKAEESFLVHDVKGEIYNTLSGELKSQGYNTVVIDLANPELGNNFNPLTLPYSLYKTGKKDEAIDILENIGRYICTPENKNPHQDPFWENSAVSLFIGLSLYLFENAAKDEINLNSVSVLLDNLSKIDIKNMDKNSPIYINLSSILLAPPETKGSIIAVFKQSIKLFTTRVTLSKLMSTTNFDIESVQKNKTAVFIISDNKPYARRLISLIIDEIYMAIVNTNDTSRRFNILIDEFDTIAPIKEFNNKLTIARSYNIKFNVCIRSYHELNHVYGKAETDILILSFGNIIYLLSNDMETLEKISKYCGKVNEHDQLISAEELKLLDNFEAIILMPRIYPIKTKLLPDYKINWNFSEEKVEIKELENKDLKIYNI